MRLGESARSLCRVMAWVGLAATATACSSTGTGEAASSIDPIADVGSTERELQLLSLHRDQQRLDDVAFPLLRAARSACADSDVSPRLGLRYASVASYPARWQAAARSSLELGEVPTVTSTPDGFPAASSGLRPGDRILAVDGRKLAPDEAGLESLQSALATLRQGTDRVRLEVERAGDVRDVSLGPALEACRYGVAVAGDIGMDVYADGVNVMVGADLVRSSSDEELAIVVSHALAHNILGYVTHEEGSLTSARPGLNGSVAFASGIARGTAGRVAPTEAGRTFPAAVELEADYVSLYSLANAGRDVRGVAPFWRQVASGEPGHAALASAHPVTGERFAQLEEVVAEIEKKREARLPLLPESFDAERAAVPHDPAAEGPPLPVRESGIAADGATGRVAAAAPEGSTALAELVEELDETVHTWLRALDAGDFEVAARMTGGAGDPADVRYWWLAIRGEAGRLTSTQTLLVRQTGRVFLLDVLGTFDSGRDATVEVTLDDAGSVIRWRGRRTPGRGGNPGYPQLGG